MEFELLDGNVVRGEGPYKCPHNPACLRRFVPVKVGSDFPRMAAEEHAAEGEEGGSESPDEGECE